MYVSKLIPIIFCFSLSLLIPQSIFCQSKKDSLFHTAHNEDIQDSLRVKALYELSYLYRDIDLDSALIYTDAMMVLAEEKKMNEYRVRYNHMMAYYFSFIDEQDSALHFLKIAEKELEKNYTLKDESAINTNYSIIYYHLGDFEKVLEYNEKAIELCKRNNNKDLSRAYGNRAIAFINMGMNVQAKTYFLLSYNESLKTNDVASTVAAMRGVAYMLGVVEGKLDSMYYYMDEVRTLCRQANDSNMWCDYYMIEKNVFNNLGKSEEALKSMENYALHAKKLNDSYKIIGAHTILANSASQAGKISLARKYYEEFDSLIPTHSFFDLIAFNYKSWAKFESENNNHHKAYDLVEKHFSYQDTVNQKRNREALIKAEAKYNSAVKDAMLAKQENQIFKQAGQQNLLISSAMLLLVLAGFLWYRKLSAEKIFLKQKELDRQKIHHLENEKKILSMSSMIEGQETERKRIAQDLHDGLGGLLSTIKVKFEVIQKEIAELESLNVFQQTSDMIDNACTEVRKIAHNMMPDSLSKLGLIEAVHDFNEQASELNIKVIDLGIHPLSNTQEIMLYRVIQEFISNTRKHANAKNIIIQFSADENQSVVYLEDDGNGFDITDSSLKRGIGIKSIESRINFINGTIELDSEIGVGTTASIHIPISAT